jgi:hypothetical protein
VSDCCCNPLGSAATPAGPVQPFIGRFFVSPSFAGTSTGSSANPFKTIAAAFAAAATQGLVAGIIYLSAETFTENVVFPPAGGAWSLQAIEEFGTFATTLTGTVTLDNNASTTFTEFSLNDLDIENTVTGVYSGGAGTDCVFRINNSFVDAAVTFTSTGGGRLICEVLGEGLWGFEDGINGALSVQGQLWTDGATIVGPVTFQGVSFAFSSRFDGGQFTSNGIAALQMMNCQINHAPTNFTAATGNLNVSTDPITTFSLLSVGCTIGANVALKTQTVNATGKATIAGNVAGQVLGARFPSSTAVVEGCQTLLVAGTLGAAVLNVTYTDLTGALVTEAVTTALNIASAVGTKARGTLPIQQNGTTALTWSVTGIVTPGPLSLAVGINYRQAS